MAHRRRSPEEHWRDNELERAGRLREGGQRTLGENLSQALALSAFVVELRDGLRRSLARKGS